MSSIIPDENDKMFEETLHKKKARRVSFAETTAVHFFNRDEESESTPEVAKDVQYSSDGKLRRSESDEIMDLLQSSSSSDDSDGGGDEDSGVLKSSFLRPFESPSSGSCFGSATSNDEDNFFGPVSAEFIRPGRLSDSAFSDENHEVTMDSTAFSLNFRSLARSDSGGEFKTPTEVRVPFGERATGLTSTSSSHGDSMVLTGAKKRVAHSSPPVDKVNDSGNSDDMSLVGGNHRRYDYGELPPDLDVLLAEGNKGLEAVFIPSDIEFSNSMNAMSTETGHELSGREAIDPTNNTMDLPKSFGGAISINLMNMSKVSDDIGDATLGEIYQNRSNHEVSHMGSMSPSTNSNQAAYQINDMSYENDKEGRIVSGVSQMFKSPSFSQSHLRNEAPVAGSISSLLSKRRHIFKDSDGLSNFQLNSPQSQIRVEGTLNRGWSTSIFAKSVSRLKKLEVSFLSASKIEGNVSRLRAPGHAQRSVEKDTHVDALAARLDLRFAESDERFKMSSESDNYGLRNSGIVNSASCIEVVKDEILGPLKSSPSPNTIAKHVVVSSSTSTMGPGLVSSKIDSHESELELNTIESVESLSRNSSLRDISFSYLEDSSYAVKRGDFVSSPGTGVVNNVSASPLYKGTPSMLNLDDKNQKDAEDFASAAELHGSFLVEKRDKSTLSSYGINHGEDISEERLMLRDHFSSPAKSGAVALKDKVSKSCNVNSSKDGVETGRTLISSTMGLPEQRMQSSPGSNLSSDARQIESPVQVLQNLKEKPVHRILLKETRDLKDHAKLNFSDGQDDANLHKLMGKYSDDAQLLQNVSNISSSDGHVGRKRKLFDGTEDPDDHVLLSQREPKICEDNKNHGDELKVSRCIESDTPPFRYLADVFTSFCGVTQQLLGPMSDKFDVALIAKLDDILVHLDKLKSCELLQHKKASDSACFLYSERVANTKLLLYKTVCQKASLQLMRLKRDKLLDQACIMKSRVEESGKLISNCHQISKQVKEVEVVCLQSECCITDTDNRCLGSAEVSSLRRECKDSDGEIWRLNKSFYACVKDTKQLNSVETTAAVKDIIKKKVACQSLQSELQLCKIERLHAMHGQPNIQFNHGGFLLQSFITKSSAASCLLLTNILNNEKISKMFINDIDPHTAFSFVFSGDMQLKYECLKTIAAQTQKTVSLLHTLLDVIQEVQLAMIELKSLTWSRFCQPSARKLDLQLCFTDFKSGARFFLNIDISCLNRGIYPLQVLPYEVRGVAAKNHDILESLVSDIRTAVRDVRCGFKRIVSICRCVSRVVQARGNK